MFVSLKPAVCQGCVALRAHSNQLIGVRFGSTHYDVLGVPRKATKKQIREAYLEQSKKLHPDQNQNDPTSHDRFVKIGEAYNVLSSPSSRLSYDNSLDPPTARPFRYTSSHAHSATRSGHARTRPPPFRDPFTHSGPDWNSDFYGQGHGYSREEFEYFRRKRKEARAEEDAARTVLMFKRRRQATQSVYGLISFVFVSLCLIQTHRAREMNKLRSTFRSSENEEQD